MDFLSDNYVDILPYPERSTDLNIIENLWGILVRDVYKYNRQFRSKNELKEAIHNARNDISISTIRNLYYSMRKRCISVIERSGGKINF